MRYWFSPVAMIVAVWSGVWWPLAVFVALLLLRPLMLSLLLLLSASFQQVLLVLGVVALVAFIAHQLATDSVALPGWARRLL